jgi:hypothetical protein
MGDAVFAVGADRRTVRKLHALTTPADIGVDFSRNRLYVPQLESDRVTVL